MKISDNPVARCFTDDNGKEYQTAFLDGYSVGDRQLEGLEFKLTLLPDKRLQVELGPPGATAGLDKEYWEMDVIDQADQWDVFNEHSVENEGGGGEELGYEDQVNPPNRPIPVPATEIKWTDMRSIIG